MTVTVKVGDRIRFAYDLRCIMKANLLSAQPSTLALPRMCVLLCRYLEKTRLSTSIVAESLQLLAM